MSVRRGVTSIREGYRTDDNNTIYLPALERDPDFIRELKIGSPTSLRHMLTSTIVVAETVFDTFLSSYLFRHRSIAVANAK